MRRTRHQTAGSGSGTSRTPATATYRTCPEQAVLAEQGSLRHAPPMTDAQEPDVADLSSQIIGAERRPVHPRAEADYPNPGGGFANILYPVRGYILLAALVLIPVLVIVSILT